MAKEDSHDPIRSGSELVSYGTSEWITPNDVTSTLVILVHGFTSHGEYMKRLAAMLQGYGFCSATFNYDSHLGIDRAAMDLESRLRPLWRALQKKGIALVAHSMGGLVVRWLMRQLTLDQLACVRGAVTLGTPHAGTLSEGVVARMLDWAEWLTLPNPYARSPGCRSARQLILVDEDKLIETLNREESNQPLGVPTLSISGGLRALEFGRSPFYNSLMNNRLQKLLGGAPNDGLVLEESANLSLALGGSNGLNAHENGYSDYAKTNHTHLVRNQEIATIVTEWLLARVGQGSVEE